MSGRVWFLFTLLLGACADATPEVDAGDAPEGARVNDAGVRDAARPGAGRDAGPANVDAPDDDAADDDTPDARIRERDAGRRADTGTADAGAREDAGRVDAGKGTAGVWRPAPGTRWQWDLTGDVSKLDLEVDVYDIDGFETDEALVAQLHAMGKKAICYLSVGTYEPGRADAKDFPKAGLGKHWPEWDETYIDIRSEGIRAVMKKRLDMCQSKGFDGVEPDNMDMFEGGMSDTGFPLTEADGVDYARWLADEVHARGMSIGQKNASSITAAIEDVYDWALTEDCFADGWCDEMKSYPEQGKALFMCEYTDTGVDFPAACASAKQQNFSAILKRRDLDAWIEFCPD